MDSFSPQSGLNINIPSWNDCEIIAHGELRGPWEKTIVSLDSQGNLYRKDTGSNYYTGQPPLILIGKVQPNGQFRLISGEEGNIFSSALIRLAVGDTRTPYGEALRQTERIRALQNSEIPWIRKNLTQKGWTGQGVTVAIIEPEIKEEKPMESQLHTFAVASVITDPRYGVAPKAEVKFFDAGDGGSNLIISQPSVWNGKVIPPLQDNVDDLNQRIAETVVYGYQNMAVKLQKIIERHDPAIRLINMSMSGNRLDLYLNLADILKEKDEEGDFKYPNLRAVILGPGAESAKLDDEEILQNSIYYVDAIMKNHPAIRQAGVYYQEATRKISQAGIIIVVSASNNRDRLPYALKTQSGWDYNELAMSPYVISVAASDTQGTPGEQGDDTVAPFSSAGDRYQWNPTLAAPGTGILVPRWTAPNGVQYGTSFSAPYVTGSIALMLQKNPTLSFSQVKNILQNTAVHVPISHHLVGSGLINPVAALAATPMPAGNSVRWQKPEVLPSFSAAPFQIRFFND